MITLVSAILIQGCLPGAVVRESNKDTSGTYDGRWMGTITKTPNKQYAPGNTILTCGDRSGGKFGPMSVSGGQLTLNFGNESMSTFVSSSGNFRLELPASDAGYTSQSNRIANRSGTLIITGALDKGTGTFVAAAASLGNTGCKSSMTFKKI